MSEGQSSIATILHQYDPQHFDPPIDPVEHAIAQGHMVAVDILTEILKAETPSRCLQIHELMKSLVLTLESVELTALSQADDLNGK